MLDVSVIIFSRSLWLLVWWKDVLFSEDSEVTNEDINKLRTIIKEHAEKSSLVVIGGKCSGGSL